MRTALSFALVVTVLSSITAADDPTRRDSAVYVDKVRIAVIEEMKKENERQAEEARREADETRARLAAQRKRPERELRPDISGLDKPRTLDEFGRIWHQPPQAQYLTGTCWAFAGTSFAESEIRRRYDRTVKLSEMWSVYWEWVEKARAWAAQRGALDIGEGSQPHVVLELWARHGVVPHEAYRGVLEADGRHDHAALSSRLNALFAWLGENEIYDEDLVEKLVRQLLDETMGVVPSSFVVADVTYTPASFRDAFVQLSPQDYVGVISILREPFWKPALFDAPDNWRRESTYVNVPLGVFVETLRRALGSGYGAALSIDTSEPGMIGVDDVAIIPSWDIPAAFIDQAAREFRLASGATSDDHSVHAVGSIARGDTEWWLIKDSNRTSRLGSLEGYMMLRRDYVQLKVLSAYVAREAIAPILATAP